MSLELYRKKILELFTLENVVKNSHREPQPAVWQKLEEDVVQWWKCYKDWEAKDTVKDAWNEQRLTVKGVAVSAHDTIMGATQFAKEGV